MASIYLATTVLKLLPVFYRAWLSEMMAIITADELAHDLPGAEAMMTRYKEHKAELDSHADAFNKFNQTGEAFISNKHFLSDEVSHAKMAI